MSVLIYFAPSLIRNSLLATCLGRLEMSIRECGLIISAMEEKLVDRSHRILLPYSGQSSTLPAVTFLQQSVRGADVKFVRQGGFGDNGRCEVYVTDTEISCDPS